MAIRAQTFKTGGMHCAGCETVIETTLEELCGVKQVKANYLAGSVEVIFDDAKIGLGEMFWTLQQKGYPCAPIVAEKPRQGAFKRAAVTLFALLGIAALLYGGSRISHGLEPLSSGTKVSYGLLFLIGLLTGFHCIGMCGPFIVSYTARFAQKGGHAPLLSHVVYGLAKTLSYTALGACFGLLGSWLTFTPTLRGAAAIAAGLFLLSYGMSMLHWLPRFRWLYFQWPRRLSRITQRAIKKHSSPFFIGLLNGLMIACGPLQAMYVMAAGTGSALEGAKRLFIFGLGTLPLMLGFGFLAGLISNRATQTLLRYSGILVVALGLIMLNRGLILTGSGYDFNALWERALRPLEMTARDWLEARQAVPSADYQTIYMEVTEEGYRPNRFMLKKAVPVKWIIDGKALTACNRRIIVPKLGLEFDIREGLQVIEFTPPEEDAIVIPWSCWMGMLHGRFIVKDGSGKLKPHSPPKPSGSVAPASP